MTTESRTQQFIKQGLPPDLARQLAEGERDAARQRQRAEGPVTFATLEKLRFPQISEAGIAKDLEKAGVSPEDAARRAKEIKETLPAPAFTQEAEILRAEGKREQAELVEAEAIGVDPETVRKAQEARAVLETRRALRQTAEKAAELKAAPLERALKETRGDLGAAIRRGLVTEQEAITAGLTRAEIDRAALAEGKRIGVERILNKLDVDKQGNVDLVHEIEKGITVKALSDAGFSPTQALDAKRTAEAIKEFAKYTNSAGNTNLVQAFQQGASFNAAILAGYSPTAVLNASKIATTLDGLKEFTTAGKTDLVTAIRAGAERGELVAAGFSSRAVQTAHGAAAALDKIESLVGDVKSGVALEDLIALGVTQAELIRAGFKRAEIERAQKLVNVLPVSEGGRFRSMTQLARDRIRAGFTLAESNEWDQEARTAELKQMRDDQRLLRPTLKEVGETAAVAIVPGLWIKDWNQLEPWARVLNGALDLLIIAPALKASVGIGARGALAGARATARPLATARQVKVALQAARTSLRTAGATAQQANRAVVALNRLESAIATNNAAKMRTAGREVRTIGKQLGSDSMITRGRYFENNGPKWAVLMQGVSGAAGTAPTKFARFRNALNTVAHRNETRLRAINRADTGAALRRDLAAALERGEVRAAEAKARTLGRGEFAKTRGPAERLVRPGRAAPSPTTVKPKPKAEPAPAVKTAVAVKVKPQVKVPGRAEPRTATATKRATEAARATRALARTRTAPSIRPGVKAPKPKPATKTKTAPRTRPRTRAAIAERAALARAKAEPSKATAPTTATATAPAVKPSTRLKPATAIPTKPATEKPAPKIEKKKAPGPAEPRARGRGLPLPRRRFNTPAGPLKAGTFPAVVAWDQGLTRITFDLRSGQRSFKALAKAGKPRETFKVVKIMKRPPQPKITDLGIVDINVTSTGLTFKASKEARRPRPRSPFKRRRF